MAEAAKGPLLPAVQQRPRPWPLVSWCCLVLATAQLVAAAWVLFRWGLAETIQSPDPGETRNVCNALLLVLPALLLEGCYLLSASGNRPGVQLHGYQTSFLVILQLAKKVLIYWVMAQGDGGIVHVNMRAWGPQRGCYTMRYVDWVIGVPTFVAINYYPLIGDKSAREFLRLLSPNLLASAGYVSACWVAQVTPDATAGWCLISMSVVTYMFTVVDQIHIIKELQSGVQQYISAKIAVVALKEVEFAAYGMVYLLGICNVVNSRSEQAFYTYGDAILKVAQASLLVMIRNWEDLATIEAALEAKVSRSKEDMSRLIRRANAPILSMDVRGHITGWNEHLVRVSQITEQEALGRHLPDLVQDECRVPLLEAIESSRQGLHTGAIELTLLPRGGAAASDLEEQKPAQMLMSFVMQLGDDSSGVVAVGQDITELAEMKAVQLRRAVFTAMVGHELRSPLHGIMGLSGAMAEAATSPGQKKQLCMIRGCATRLLDLVTNIMEMAKSERELQEGKDKMPPAGDANLMDIVEEVVGMTCAAVDKSGKPLVSPQVQLVNNMKTGSLPLIKGDAYKITQLVYNLVTNACKFTKQGSVSFACRHDEASSMLEFDVADTGVGISQKALGRIFEPFEQEDKKDARSFQGIGLGLSVARGIVTLHRGSISVQSTVGKGSTFTVRLPCDNTVRAGLSHSSAPEERRAVEPQQQANGASQQVQVARPTGEPAVAFVDQKRLLLSVDDDEINQEVIERTLGTDYRIVRAMNGHEALSYLQSGQEVPSIVLLDVMMPGITGFKVCSEIRSKLRFGHLVLPVVMLSARSPYEDTALESYRCGATDHMMKPFSATMLKLRLGVIAGLQRELSAMGVNFSELKCTFPALPDTGAAAEADDAREALQRALAERDELQLQLSAMSSLELASKAEAQADAQDAREALRLALVERDQLQASLEAQRLPTAAECAAGAMTASSSEAGQPTCLPMAPLTPDMATVGGPGAWRVMRKMQIRLAMVQSALDAASRDAAFFQGEVQQRDMQVADLCERLRRCKTKASLHEHRSETLDRQLRYMEEVQRGSAMLLRLRPPS